MNERYYDNLLNIRTRGTQEGFLQYAHYNRYEPTPYLALETLFSTYELNPTDQIVDFGCGKGRLNFYINYRFSTSVVGIEMNKALYQQALENQAHYLKKAKHRGDKIHFHCCLAENYPIDSLDNRFYFFNPFSVEIFIKIINNILDSVERSERDIELILYYPSIDYISYLECQNSFEPKMEIKLPVLYEKNPNERFIVYRLVR
ncbi:methyltransferase [Terrilactibacillus sp. BCM23-1]|uniref:Methyltransferase n=1 Tax=Terrilactibacillus tamarindi TaxID=2599694 RepID=A0A6N8CVM9_9BACI|nr:methyltransferase [Terrilactibacillus tamarindi]MTT33345.1 methyltransferase [Terrilactibacillus tamarindi]